MKATSRSTVTRRSSRAPMSALSQANNPIWRPASANAAVMVVIWAFKGDISRHAELGGASGFAATHFNFGRTAFRRPILWAESFRPVRRPVVLRSYAPGPGG